MHVIIQTIRQSQTHLTSHSDSNASLTSTLIVNILSPTPNSVTIAALLYGHMMYTIENSNERNDRLYCLRKTRAQQSSHQLHRAIWTQPEYLTTAEKSAIYRWLRTVPSRAAEASSLKSTQFVLPYASSNETDIIEELHADCFNGSNLERSNESVRAPTAVTATSGQNHAAENGRQTLKKRLYDCTTAKNDRGGISTKSNSTKHFRCAKSEQLSPGTERDADHESIGERSAGFQCDCVD